MGEPGSPQAEDMRNVATGLKQIYSLPDDRAFDDLLIAIDRSARAAPRRGGPRLLRSGLRNGRS
jgi:hypothetical protein